MSDPWFEANFTDDEEEIIVEECICSECNGVFILEKDTEISNCPLCNTHFDRAPEEVN